jgi:uncharacterized membrane protein YdbT with pleckstrin-like domain
VDLLSGETVLWKGSPSWRALLLFYTGGTLGALLPLVLWALLDDVMSDGPSVAWFALATLVLLVIVYVGGWIRRATTRYTITDRRINVRTGLLTRNEVSTTITRIQNVNVHQRIGQRLLGIGDVDWDTAGSDVNDSDLTFRGVENPGDLMRVVDEAIHAHPGEAAAPGL